MAVFRATRRSLFWVYLIGLWAGSFAASVSAQVTPDGTLGNEASQVNPNSLVNGLPADVIEGGAVRGENLFHSFSEFNVEELQRLYFANPIGIENILSRVTGGDASNILGTLGVDGGANLYFLNPNGIIFGPNAQLDISGSFFASTADTFDFGNGDIYSALNPELPPLVAIDITPGLQFSQTQRAIANEAVLTVGQDLTLAGGNLELSGQLLAGENLALQAQDTVTIRDAAAQPFMATAGQDLTVQGNQGVDIFALNHPASGLFSGSEMMLRSPTPVIGDARFYSNGNFTIEQLDGGLGNLTSPSDPVILANEDVFLGGYQGASLHILAGGSVTIRDFVWIQAADPVNGLVDDTLQLRNGETINGQVVPTLDIRAGIDWSELPNNTQVGNFLPTPPDFNAVDASPSANIEVGTIFFADANSSLDPAQGPAIPVRGVVSLTNRYQPNNAPASEANIDVNAVQAAVPLLAGRSIVNGDFTGGGYIEIQSRGDITIDGIVNADPPAFFDGFNNQVFGNGGDIALVADGNIILSQGALLNSRGLQGGNIDIESGNTFSASGPSSLPGVLSGIQTSSVGTTPGVAGGTVNIIADAIALSGPMLITTDTEGAVDGGTIDIQTQNLQLSGGAEILSRTFGTGQAGDVFVQPRDLNQPSSITLDGVSPDFVGFDESGNPLLGGFSSGLFSTSEPPATGDGGQVTILDFDEVNIRNGAVISARTRTNADGGTIFIDNVGTLNLEGGGQILTTAFANGAAGDIIISARDLVTIAGSDPSYEIRSNNLFNTRYAEFIAANSNTIPSPRLESQARLFAIDAIEATIDPTSQFSGLQASNNLNFIENTNPDGSISLVPVLDGLGAPGIISVSSPTILLSDGATLTTSTVGQNDGGIIGLQTNFLSITGGASALSQNFGSGEGGSILVSRLDDSLPSSVFISGVVPLSTSTVSGRPEGAYSSGLVSSTENLDIALLEDPLFDLSFLPATTGAGGLISVEMDDLTIADGGVLSARSRSNGDSLGILVNVNSLDMSSGGQILAPAYREGEAGAIFVTTQNDISLSGFDPDYGTRFETFESNYVDYLTNLFVNFYGLPFDEANALATDRAVIARRFTIDPVNSRTGFHAQAGFDSSGSGIISVTSNGSLSLEDFASIDSNNFGLGDSAGIFIDVANEVSLNGNGLISSAVQNNSNRTVPIAGGSVLIEAGSLSADNNSEISVATFGLGDAGRVEITAPGPEGDTGPNDALGDISLAGGSSIRAGIESGGNGNGGGIIFDVSRLSMTEGSQAIAGVFRPSDLDGDGILEPGGVAGPDGAGDILIFASEGVEISGQSSAGFSSGLFVSTEANAQGEAGSILILTDLLSITDNGLVTASTENRSDAGSINLNVLDTLLIANGGLVSVDGPIDENGQVFVDFPGDPGNINIVAGNFVLDEGGKIRARTASIEDTANINITAGSLLLRGSRTELDPLGSCPTCNEISTEALANDATGGNIILQLNGISAVRDENSDIVANAAGNGGGGRIDVILPTDADGRSPFNLEAMFRLQEGRSIESDLDASSELGAPGEVNVAESTPVEPVVVPDQVDPSDLVDRRCELIASGNPSEFSVTGRGGLPTDPGAFLEDSPLLEDFGPDPMPVEDDRSDQSLDDEALAANPPELIQEPQNFRVAEDGSVYLYAETPTNATMPGQGVISCQPN
ncbi:filamentous hemagglutinin N-terminal domain-containing protein [Oscillatoria sp. CS-180]|uniref:two-partner secretion domain-containing protein n=1 Tax=Oscillatoria sp. CS-180 TaxID=3021720 RepID=UPI0023302CE1|nr:filamentous hemagglutinin N-terminal domain-containing protein [Oscillatoria sp. CS-180]MDB9528838.1 filamentous hemagglutinin N-terminal domain-containing protein [Oscillatoria sp. CS-180]